MVYDSKKSENEWFTLHEMDLLRNVRIEKERKQKELEELLKQDEARKQKELHWMRCPKCGANLFEQNLLGVQVEECPLCDGIHFDSTELQELILKSQKERREILYRILGIHFADDSQETDSDKLLGSLHKERQLKDKELEWVLNQGEAKERKDLHWMKCPKCGSDMKEQEHEGVAIDVCSVCEGVFLDHIDFQTFLLKKVEVRRNVLKRLFGIFSS